MDESKQKRKPMTGAERQAKLRTERAAGDAGTSMVCLNLWISSEAKRKLEVLAELQGSITLREGLEQVIDGAVMVARHGRGEDAWFRAEASVDAKRERLRERLEGASESVTE